MSDTPRTDAECVCIAMYAAGASPAFFCDKHGFVRTDPRAIEAIVAERIRTNAVESQLRAELAAAKRDAERYRWALPILTAQGKEGDERAMRLALALTKGLDGDEAIDAAIQESAP